MSHNILVTGASGYLGGTLLARWKSANLPPYGKLYALVRSDQQAEAVKQYGAEPLEFDLNDKEELRNGIVGNEISIIFWLIDSFSDKHQPPLIEALAEVKAKTGREVHFIHTGGAKHFSSHANLPTDKPLLDTDPKLYEILKTSTSPLEYFAQTIKTNVSIIDTSEKYGVRGYIFAPCIVYGQSEGFGNQISIQTVAIVKAAKKARRVYKVDPGNPTWPVCHIVDNTTLYVEMLRNMLLNIDIGYNKNGFYLAASGSVAWEDIYKSMATALAKRNLVDDDIVSQADNAVLEKMAEGLGAPSNLVNVMLGGKCTYTAVHGTQIGWKPQYPPEHILETADEEVELILKHINE
ncbi:hypothetical protein BGW36DRAFT_393760 [Talaromyces proteolyticus]|uniref:NAD-dependent epimerase/dehydratase domain-containing protein n=1 Tax=Talaromyces proteolyticus TaxID=1131652 RepID=A0AAD4PZV5_9EURO|nr:uncharacterized protein BGW36DRAFT_393760 [Talaromyces proteolyticus]KAH8703413.1 hypothetical protein BGW36DRAFT_393760 [Talaromyces proteolyticus]